MGRKGCGWQRGGCTCASAGGLQSWRAATCGARLLTQPLPGLPPLPQHYELHRNDCRHYINCLVKYTTGQEQAASACLASQWQRARERGTYGLATGVVRLTQFFTDLANWGKVQVRGPVSRQLWWPLSGSCHGFILLR